MNLIKVIKEKIIRILERKEELTEEEDLETSDFMDSVGYGIDENSKKAIDQYLLDIYNLPNCLYFHTHNNPSPSSPIHSDSLLNYNLFIAIIYLPKYITAVIVQWLLEHLKSRISTSFVFPPSLSYFCLATPSFHSPSSIDFPFYFASCLCFIIWSTKAWVN